MSVRCIVFAAAALALSAGAAAAQSSADHVYRGANAPARAAFEPDAGGLRHRASGIVCPARHMRFELVRLEANLCIYERIPGVRLGLQIAPASGPVLDEAQCQFAGPTLGVGPAARGRFSPPARAEPGGNADISGLPVNDVAIWDCAFYRPGEAWVWSSAAAAAHGGFAVRTYFARDRAPRQDFPGSDVAGVYQLLELALQSPAP